MTFNPLSRRSVVMGFGGAVATSQPLAAMAGLRVLMQGGHAADAAVAAAAALTVVEPMSTGMGGDAFALIYQAKEHQVYALNASGRAPAGATLEAYQQRGHNYMPARGILSVTVPGGVMGWADLVSRFGRLGLDTVLAPAIAYAENGFPVSERISISWLGCQDLLRQYHEAARTYLVNGRTPRPGERFRSPDLARSLRSLAEQGPDAFYRGPIADAIVSTSERHGGLLTHRDLYEHCSCWEEPISTDYRGYRVYECPPPGQGIAALIALNILNDYNLSETGFASADAFHLKMEAIKLGMADSARYVADPQRARVPVRGLLSAEFAQQRRDLIHMDRAIADPRAGMPPTSHDTVYVSVVDGEGNAVSFINSLYMNFGSGIVADGTGIMLQNRGNGFSLHPQHPNCIAPDKRPFHTIIPAMVTRSDGAGRKALYLCYGVMGGFMQAQGHVQVLTNIVNHGMNVQRAFDMPRFNYQGGRRFFIEPHLPNDVYAGLRRRGHDLTLRAGGNYGGGQGILIHPETGALMAGSEPRNDGCALAF